MAKIRPFRGLRYNLQRVGDLAEVTAPPYDVITPEVQEAYHRRNPFNVIRLELPLEYPGDGPANNKYSRAAACLEDWLKDGILSAEEQPAIFPYEQTFNHRGRKLVRRSILTRLKLADWSEKVVFPHEYTFPKPKQDRLELTRACAANISPVFGLYEDPQQEISNLLEAVFDSPPAASFTDDGGEGHRLWVVNDGAIIQHLASALSPRCLFIADGHHRYETALNYRDEMRAAHPNRTGDKPWEYVLIALCAMEDPGLLVLPIHRLVRHVPTERINRLKEGLLPHFNVEALPLDGEPEMKLPLALKEMAKRQMDSIAFGLCGLEPDTFHLLTLRDSSLAQKTMPAEKSRSYRDKSAAWKRLSTSLLHTVIIEGLLGIEERDVLGETHISYTKDEQYALRMLQRGEYQLAFFLNPTRFEEIRDVALAGDRMPHKSTYFYPKLITGLVINYLKV